MSEGNVAADQLRLLIERIERLEEEKKGINDDIKDVYLEAKATGYDAKIMRQIIRLRKMPVHDRQEMQAVLETYLSALGMEDGPGRQQSMYDGHDGRPDPTTPAPAPTATEEERFKTALSLVVKHQNASTSWLQRQMRIGYNSAAKLVEELEQKGVVGPPDHIGKREILVPPNGEAHPALAMMYEAAGG
jgi:uncharacterized protein (UPF0335 family)